MPKRQKAKKLAQQGATKREIKKATGFRGKTARYFVKKYAPSPAQTSDTSQTAEPAPSTPKIKGVGQGLRIAGAGGISGSDLRTIQKATGKSNEQLISKLDKVNKKLKSKGKTGISLNSGALNKIIKEGIKQRAKNPFGIVDFGTGKFGQDIMSRMGDPGSRGYYRQGQLIGAREAVEPRFLYGGMQIRPGGRPRVRGFGSQYELPEKYKPKDEVVDDTTTDVSDTSQETEIVEPEIVEPEIVEPEITEPESVDTSLSSGGLDLASWATGFKRARSSRQRAGRRAQGLASQKKTPFKNKFK